MTRIVRLGVEVVVPVLIVNGEDVTQIVTRLGQMLHAFPAPGVRRGRENVGVQIVIPAKAPSIQVDVGPLDSLLGQLAKLLGPRIETRHHMVLGGVVLVVVLRFGLNVHEDAGVNHRAGDELPDQRAAGHLLRQ